jgi:hypothetical protein
MNIKDIINKCYLRLQSLKVRNDFINNELMEINYYLEIFNNLDEKMLTIDISKLKSLLETNEYYLSNLDSLILNVNNLIEYYVLGKKEELKLPLIYETKINELKECLKELKNKLENKFVYQFESDNDINNLNKMLSIINNEDNVEINNDFLRTLYEYIIKDLNEKERLELFKILLDYSKRDNNIYENNMTL